MKPTDDDSLDDALRARLADFEADPAPDAFDRIRAELPPPRPRLSRGGWVAMGVAGMLLLGTRLGGEWRRAAENGVREPLKTALAERMNRREVREEIAERSTGKTSSLGVKTGHAERSRSAVGLREQFPISNRASTPLSVTPAQKLPLQNSSIYTILPQSIFSETPPLTPESRLSISLLPLASRPLNAPNLVFPWLVAAPDALPRPAREARPRLAWFGSVAAQYAYADLTPNATDETYVRRVQSAARFAPDRLGWRMVLGVEKMVAEKTALRMAVTASSLRQSFAYSEQTHKLDSVATRRVDGEGATLQPYFQTKSSRIDFQQTMVGLTASMLRHFGPTVYVHAGGEAGLAWGSTGRQPALALTAGLGVSRPLGTGWSLRVEPTLRYSLSTFQTTDGRFGWRPYTVGLALGLRKN